MKHREADIVMIQETHCVKNSNNLWYSEWGNKVLFSNRESNARGVCTMFSKNCAGKIKDTARDM